MWNELESYKNNYLQKELYFMKPDRITPLLQKEFQIRQNKRIKCNLLNAEPHFCEKSKYFDDRSPLAYGLGALTKLFHEICSDDLRTQWRGINTLSQYLLNPLNAQRALNSIDFIRGLKNVFLRHRFLYVEQRYKEIDRILECFRIFSLYDNGAKKIIESAPLCEEIYRVVAEADSTADMAASILRNLTEKTDIVLHLWQNSNSLKSIQRIFTVDPCRPKYPYNLWLHLSHFLEIAPEDGIKYGFFEILHTRIVKKYPDYHRLTMKCFAFIIRCETGQRRFDEVDAVPLLYSIMSNFFEPLDTYEYVVMAFLHGLQSKHAMRRCCDFVNLPKILTKFAIKKAKLNIHLQLYALKALRQIGEMPCIKEYMRENCEKNLRTLVCQNEDNDCERMRLVNWLNRDIFETESNLYEFLPVRYVTE